MGIMAGNLTTTKNNLFLHTLLATSGASGEWEHSDRLLDINYYRDNNGDLPGPNFKNIGTHNANWSTSDEYYHHFITTNEGRIPSEAILKAVLDMADAGQLNAGEELVFRDSANNSRPDATNPLNLRVWVRAGDHREQCRRMRIVHRSQRTQEWSKSI